MSTIHLTLDTVGPPVSGTRAVSDYTRHFLFTFYKEFYVRRQMSFVGRFFQPTDSGIQWMVLVVLEFKYLSKKYIFGYKVPGLKRSNIKMKTAAAVLQELAVKLGRTPEYECLSQSGPQHQATFEYRCTLFDESVTASARSKKEAKQDAASALLTRLARAGHSVPPPWGLGGVGQMGAFSGQMGGLKGMGGIAGQGPPSAIDAHSYVALLKEYCDEYKLPAPDYTLIGDSGPPHLRSFTIRASVGAHSRDATALNKKTARQMAAEAMYKYLRGCLRSTQDFVEIDALERALDKKLGRFKEERKELQWRPSLSQKISEYHHGLVLQFDEIKRAAALEALRSTAEAGQPPEIQLACAASELGLETIWNEMDSINDKPMVVVELPTTSPSLVFIGHDRNDAAALMVEYLLTGLPTPKRLAMNRVEEEN